MVDGEEGEGAEEQPENDNDTIEEGAGISEAEPETILSVQIGEEAPEEESEEEKQAPQWVKDLRRENKDKDRVIRELKRAAETRDAPKLPELGPKPTLESCDYDEAAFETKLDAWKEQEREHKSKTEQLQQAQQAMEERWLERAAQYKDGRDKLGVQDYEDAEATVRDELNKGANPAGIADLRFHLLVNCSPDPNMMVYALYKNPKKLAELRDVQDITEYAFNLGVTYKDIKVTRGKQPPKPEGGFNGPTAGARATDNTLETLRAKADKTGDYTEVIRYKNQQREKERARA